MKPTGHQSHNFIFRGPVPEICDLNVFQGNDALGRPIIISHWKPDEHELQALIAGGSVRLTLYSDRMPPISVGVEQP
jgi:hypothetical protein